METRSSWSATTCPRDDDRPGAGTLSELRSFVRSSASARCGPTSPVHCPPLRRKPSGRFRIRASCETPGRSFSLGASSGKGGRLFERRVSLTPWGRERAGMAKYEPLVRYLRRQKKAEVELSFRDIERRRPPAQGCGRPGLVAGRTYVVRPAAAARLRRGGLRPRTRAEGRTGSVRAHYGRRSGRSGGVRGPAG